MTQRQTIAPEQVGRTAMLIVAALLTGLLVFAMVASVIAAQPGAQAPAFLSPLGLTAAGIAIALRQIIPAGVARQAESQLASQPDDIAARRSLAAAYLTKTILGAALLEGAGFFNLVAYLLTRSLWNLGTAGILAAIMAMTFPSQFKFDAWADQALRNRA